MKKILWTQQRPSSLTVSTHCTFPCKTDSRIFWAHRAKKNWFEKSQFFAITSTKSDPDVRLIKISMKMHMSYLIASYCNKGINLQLQIVFETNVFEILVSLPKSQFLIHSFSWWVISNFFLTFSRNKSLCRS